MKKTARILMIAAAGLLVQSCVSTKTYKITFQNGDIEYYNLDYRPKKDAKSIEYGEETILGIKEIEIVK